MNLLDFDRLVASSQAMLLDAWTQLQSTNFLLQLAAIAGAGLIAFWAGGFLGRRLRAFAQGARTFRWP